MFLQSETTRKTNTPTELHTKISSSAMKAQPIDYCLNRNIAPVSCCKHGFPEKEQVCARLHLAPAFQCLGNML
jgi:hypothetical protein